jgi:ADP-ribose pyrophosphatase YjhB (NUDIX family)
MAEIRHAKRRGVFMKVPIAAAAVIPTAADHGFRFHHAEGTTAMLLNWLPEDEPCPVPDFATHVIGLGGMCLNEKHEVLCVKEKRAPAATSQGSWKLPGGLIDLGEEIADGVAREVREETGVEATFQSLLAARHQHGAAFGRDDMYCICLLSPQTSEIKIDENEIGEAAWLSLGDYYESTKATSARQGVDENFNCYVVRHVLEACERGDDLTQLGFAGRKMPAPKGYVKGVTGLTSKPEFWMFSQWRD